MSEKGLRTRRVAELVRADLSRLLITEFQDDASGIRLSRNVLRSETAALAAVLGIKKMTEDLEETC